MGWPTLLPALGGILTLWYVVRYFLANHRKIDVRGCVVLITGANSGLGKACAEAFHRAGCHVILAGRNKEQLQQVQQQLQETRPNTGGKVGILTLDLGDLGLMGERVSEAVDMFGHVDILVNNAGISYRGCIPETDIDVDVKLMNVNYFGQVALTKALLPHMLATGKGHIVNISSVQGRVSIPYRSAYSASKHALQAFFDCLRAEVHDKNIHVCVVSPGYIQTNLSQNAVCGDGTRYGVLDATTAGGLAPEAVAGEIVRAVQHRTPELTPASCLPKLAILLRALWPSLYFWVMARRAHKQQKDYVKRS